MRWIVLYMTLVAASNAYAKDKERLAKQYFAFLFTEEVSKYSARTRLVGAPTVASFASDDGKRMIIISSSLNNGKSFYALLSVDELGMGYLAWKQRGFGSSTNQDIKYFTSYNGKQFTFNDW